MGRPFMPWQQHVMDVALEIDPVSGELWYRDVTVTVPRQSGKTSLTLPRVVWRAEAWKLLGGRQHMLYTAQTGTAAKKKWELEFVEGLAGSRAMDGRWHKIMQPNRERIRFKSGSVLMPIAPTVTAGHGDTLDDGTIDEAFSQKDDRVEKAWDPARNTRHQSQLWTPSTAGDSTWKSPYLWSRVQAGRALVESGSTDTRSAHFEWACDPALDIENPDNWWSFMPALGYTIRIDTIKHQLTKMLADPEQGLPAFRRGFGNQWSDQYDDQAWALPKESWMACLDPHSKRAQGARPALGVDMTPDRSRASVSFAAPRADGLVMGRVIRNGPGSGWLVTEVGKVAREKGAVVVAIDGTGPAANKIDDLERELAGVCELKVLTAGETADACGTMKDAVVTEQFRHVGQAELTDAVKGAVEKAVGDRMKYVRRVAGTDISTLYSVILAAAGLASQPQSKYEEGGFTTL